MSEKIQGLIDKIKAEGIDAAEQQAKDIEAKASKKAQEIIDEAKKKAEKMIADAKQEIAQKEESSKAALQQASRDMLLSLRRDINDRLQRILSWSVKEVLSSEDLVKIIVDVAKNSMNKDAKDVRVVVSEEDHKKIQKDIVAKLQKEVQGTIEVKSSNDINSGFTISFDKGKSSFEFTDASLSEYLSVFLNDEAAQILKSSVIE